ncbi:MAG: hypothetical protein R3F49_21345 [Planctomycetota bacterium]
MQHTLRFSLALAATAIPAAAQQVLMVVDSGNDRVMQYNATDGSLINENFIVGGSGAFAFGTPKEAIQVNDEIWVVDQIADSLFIFDLAGNYLSTITGGLDNLRGGEFINGTVYITNAGTGNSAPGPAIVSFDTAGNNLGFFPTQNTSPFDLVPFNGELVVTDFAADTVDRYDFAGNYLGALAAGGTGTALNQPEQISLSAQNTVVVAAFGAPIGVYEYDTTGGEIGYIPTNAGLRGAWRLGNGNMMYTSSLGVFVYDVATMTSTDVTPAGGGTSGQNVSLLDLSQTGSIGTVYCSPAVPNTSGNSATMSASGSVVAAQNSLTLTADGLPTNAFGFFLTSTTQGALNQPGGSQGVLCLGGSIGRYVGPGQIQNSGAQGQIMLALDLTQTPTPTGLVTIMSGETWNFTAWFRDSVGGTATSNFANGLEIFFQ